MTVARWGFVVAATMASTLVVRDAAAAVPSTVAVVEIDDRNALSADVRAHLSTHLRAELARDGTSVVAVAGDGPALRAVAPAALVTTIVVVGRRFVLVAQIRDLETQAVIAEGRGEVDVPQGVSPERRLRAALIDISAQLRGDLPNGQLRAAPPGDDDPEAPPPAPEPSAPPPEPEPEAPNRYAIHPGVTARAGRFVGLLEIALATNDTRRAYTPIQLAGWKNRVGTFVGALQLSLRQNRADEEFVGATQVSLVDNDAVRFVGLAQIAPRNDVASFTGVGQVGLLNMVGEGADGSDVRYVGLAQVGAVNVHHHDVYTLAQVGATNLGGRATMNAGASLSVATLHMDGDVRAGLQGGVVALTGGDFSGIVQAGALAGTLRGFYGIAQVGLVSYVGNNLYREVFGFSVDNSENDRESFHGVVQAGAFAMVDHDVRALAQLGALATYVDEDAYALAQLGLVNYVGHSFYGVAQVGALNLSDEVSAPFELGVVSYVGHDFYGGSFGAVNLARRVHGAQIGVVNVCERLYGVQIGLVNFAEKNGILPVMPVLNLGF